MFDLKNKKIFVAGHNGMVGSSIMNELNFLNLEVLTAEKNELDLKDLSLVNNWFKKKKPDVVIIAAAKVGGIHANSSYPVQFLLDNLKIQNNLIEISYNHDVKKLLEILHKFVEKKNTVIVIEHNLDVIKSSDWIIDLGPEGGEKGGYILFEGEVQKLLKKENNDTAQCLTEYIRGI